MSRRRLRLEGSTGGMGGIIVVESLMRKLMLLAVATALIMLLIGGRLIGKNQISTVSEQAARQLTLRHVPATAILLETQAHTRNFQFVYYDIPTSLHYWVEIDRKSGRVEEVKASLADPSGSAKLLLDEPMARWLIGHQFPDADIQWVRLLEQDGRRSYRVAFAWTGLAGTAALNAETGQLLEYLLRAEGGVPIPVAAAPVATVQAAVSAGYLPEERIRMIALNHIVGGFVLDLDLESTADGYVYIVQLFKQAHRFVLSIDAATGIVLSIEQI